MVSNTSMRIEKIKISGQKDERKFEMAITLVATVSKKLSIKFQLSGERHFLSSNSKAYVALSPQARSNMSSSSSFLLGRISNSAFGTIT